MSNETCILTTRDFMLLESLRARRTGPDDPLAPILKRKLDHAVVVFHDDVPEDVATLCSCVTFSVNGGAPATRVISSDLMTGPVGMFLPVTTPRGLALIGLAAGQSFSLAGQPGGAERILLEKVHHQPEAARRAAPRAAAAAVQARRSAGARS